MKKKVAVMAAGLLMTLSLAGCSKTGTSTYSLIVSNPSDGLSSLERNRKRSLVLSNTIWKDFYDEELPASYEYYPFRDGSEEIASAWHYTSLLSLYNKLLKLYPNDEGIKNKHDILFDGLEYYRENRSDYRVYAVNRGFKKRGVVPGINTNVYDDNEWIAREFLNAYEETKNEDYLTACKETVAYTLTGWDTSINSATGKEWGGLYWGPYYTSKHTCSNAPLVGILTRLYEETKDDSYLTWAKKIYAFSYDNFRNADGCYGDLVGTTRDVDGNTIAQATLDTTEYTYNTGTMITGAAELFRITKEEHYLAEAKDAAEASWKVFANSTVKDGFYQMPFSSTLYFNMVLYEGYYSLLKVDSTAIKYFDGIQKSLDFCYNNYLYEGYLPVGWIQGWIYGLDADSYHDIRDVDANAETYAMLSIVDSMR